MIKNEREVIPDHRELWTDTEDDLTREFRDKARFFNWSLRRIVVNGEVQEGVR